MVKEIKQRLRGGGNDRPTEKLEANKKLARDYIDRVFNQHNPDKAAVFVTGDVIWHGGGLGDIAGPENLAACWSRSSGRCRTCTRPNRTSSPGTTWSSSGSTSPPRSREACRGAPADGKPVHGDAVDIYRVTDGKISEEWAADDVAAIMAQIGAFNPP